MLILFPKFRRDRRATGHNTWPLFIKRMDVLPQSFSLEAARVGLSLFQFALKLTGTSAAVLR